jgi:glycosyltransferase involved in cell wall biosynthesis
VLPEFYNRATLFVFPSILESFGFPVLEAMAAETPVLASSAAAIPEIVGDGGRYFDPNDPDQLAVLLEQTLESDSNEPLIQRGKARVRKFTWENCAAKTASVLTQE